MLMKEVSNQLMHKQMTLATPTESKSLQQLNVHPMSVSGIMDNIKQKNLSGRCQLKVSDTVIGINIHVNDAPFLHLCLPTHIQTKNCLHFSLEPILKLEWLLRIGQTGKGQV